MKNWKTLSSKIIEKNPFHSYRVDEFEREDGTRGTYHYLDKRACCISIPMTKEGKFILVGAYRYTHNTHLWEFPMGTADPGEDDKEGVRREMIEETGYDAKTMILLGRFQNAPGASNQMAVVYLARDLFKSSEFEPDENEGLLPKKEVTQKEFESMIKNGEITDSVTLAAYTLYLQHQ